MSSILSVFEIPVSRHAGVMIFILQMFGALPQFRNWIFSMPPTSKLFGALQNCLGLQILLPNLSESIAERAKVKIESNLNSFLYSLQLSQEYDLQNVDISELINMVVDALEREEKAILPWASKAMTQLLLGRKDPNSILYEKRLPLDIFKLIARSSGAFRDHRNLKDTQSVVEDFIHCKVCNNHSAHTSVYNSLSVAIQNTNSLANAFEQQFESELLEQENQYFCTKCKKKQDALKGSAISSCGELVQVDLRMMEFDFMTMQRVKVSVQFDIPETFDFGPWMSSKKPCPCTLQGALLHIGSANSGYFVSIFRNVGKQDSWLQYQSGKISELSKFPTRAEMHQNAAPFLLFYAKTTALQFDLVPDSVLSLVYE